MFTNHHVANENGGDGGGGNNRKRESKLSSSKNRRRKRRESRAAAKHQKNHVGVISSNNVQLNRTSSNQTAVEDSQVSFKRSKVDRTHVVQKNNYESGTKAKDVPTANRCIDEQSTPRADNLSNNLSESSSVAAQKHNTKQSGMRSSKNKTGNKLSSSQSVQEDISRSSTDVSVVNGGTSLQCRFDECLEDTQSANLWKSMTGGKSIAKNDKVPSCGKNEGTDRVLNEQNVCKTNEMLKCNVNEQQLCDENETSKGNGKMLQLNHDQAHNRTDMRPSRATNSNNHSGIQSAPCMFDGIDASLNEPNQFMTQTKSSHDSEEVDFSANKSPATAKFEVLHQEASKATKKKQITLTQGDFLKEDVKEVKAKLSLKSEEGPSLKQQITLTQGDFVKNTETNSNTTKQHFVKSEEGNGMESVTMRKPGTLNQYATYSRGDVWLSSDPEFAGCAFTLDNIHVVNTYNVADISQMWMRLDQTFIGPEEAAKIIAKRPECEWVMVDEHPLIPKDNQIQLKKLSHKMSDDEMPKSPLCYIENHPTFQWFIKDDHKQFTPPPNDNKPIGLELFAGCGGMSVGLKQAGWDVKFKVDNDTACCHTLRKNHPKKKIMRKDVSQLLLELMSGKHNDMLSIVYLHASPPCQAFCLANTSDASKDWQNRQATIDFLKVVEYISPPFVSMENVPGMAANRKKGFAESNKAYLQRVIATLVSLGYNVVTSQILASHYGDPQERKRLIILAAKQGYKLPSIPVQTHGDVEGMLPIATVQNVLQDLETIEPNGSGRIKLNKKTVEGHFIDGTHRGDNNDDDIRSYADHPLPPAHETAKTIIKKNKILHYNQDRYLTILEYKRLQSFPDKLELIGNKKEMRDMIGNAVPCKMAEAIGKSVMDAYKMGTHN